MKETPPGATRKQNLSNVKKCGEHDKIGVARDLAGSLTKSVKKRKKTVEIDEKVVKIKKKASVFLFDNHDFLRLNTLP